MTRLPGVAGDDPPVDRELPADVLWHYLRRQPELNKPHVSADPHPGPGPPVQLRRDRVSGGHGDRPFYTVIFLAIMLALAVRHLLPTRDVQT